MNLQLRGLVFIMTLGMAVSATSCGSQSAPPQRPTSSSPSTSESESFPTDTATPTPAPTAIGDPGTTLDWSQDEGGVDLHLIFDGVCTGRVLDGYAPYAGDIHPLVIAGETGANGEALYEGNMLLSSPPSWAEPQNLGDYQLVACPTTQTHPAASCGSYRRDDGVIGQMLRTQDTVTLRVVVASTGQEIGHSAVTADLPACPAKVTITGDPPWTEVGGVEIAQLIPVLTGFATGAPRSLGN